ncbi:MAG: VanW family protein [Patescibacteria group bacterium]
MARSKHFHKTIFRLSIAGAIILIGFPLGMFAYFHNLKLPESIHLRSLQSAINQASSHDTTVIVGTRKFIIKKGEISKWTEEYTRKYTGLKDTRFSDASTKYVKTLAQKTDHEPSDARFTIENGIAVVFIPAQTGQNLNIVTADAELRRGILADSSEIILTQEVIVPNITAEKINSLGLNDRIAVGESNFAGSTLARIQNIKVSSKKYNGHIIKAGESFSFNTVLGDVVASTGYAPEKVIKNGKIEYEYGGGICQVSTTLFRAAIMAGFPILERKNHAFPVHYYEPQGFDATIYPGVSDMRFINDTGRAVLIQTHTVGTKIFFEIYGTSDGRKVTIDGPYQYEQMPDGSMKAYFTRKITNPDGTIKEQRFNSTYKSPALYPTEPNPYI